MLLFAFRAAMMLAVPLPQQPAILPSVVPGPPRRPLPRPVANAPLATVNQNLVPGGTLNGRTLTLALDVVEAAYQPEGPNDPVVRILAFAEAGKAPSVPGPLLRAAAGTTVNLTLRNRSDSAVIVGGLRQAMAAEKDTINLAPGATRQITFRLDSIGNFFYWAAMKGLTSWHDREWLDSQLNGALIVDPPGTPFGQARDRVWLISEWFHAYPDKPFESALVFNGKAWPYNERLTIPQNDSVHWRVINTAAIEHPIHLHGFYFRVERRGGPHVDTAIAPTRQALQNMQVMAQGGTMTISFAPTTPGNWVFHCHFASHIGEDVSLTGSPDAFTMPGPQLAGSEHEHSSAPGGHEMRGLVIGLHVTPAPGYRAPVVADRRTLHLYAQKQPGALDGGETGYGFMLQKGDSIPPKDKIQIPGPVLELKRGQPVRVVVHNTMDEYTGVHWHGLEIESYPDGVPNFSGMDTKIMPPIPPGQSFAAEFTPPRAGTFPYHAHLHEMRQIGSGMYGAIVVTDAPRDTTRDHLIVAGGGGRPVFDKGFVSVLLVNGRRTARPIHMTVGDTNRLRIVSIHADWILAFRLGDDSTVARWRPLARDGADLPTTLRAPRPATVTMGPGETADFLYVPTRPGKLTLEVWQWDIGNRVVVPIEVSAKGKAPTK